MKVSTLGGSYEGTLPGFHVNARQLIVATAVVVGVGILAYLIIDKTASAAAGVVDDAFDNALSPPTTASGFAVKGAAAFLVPWYGWASIIHALSRKSTP